MNLNMSHEHNVTFKFQIVFRRVGSCTTDQVVNKLGWAKTVSNEWLVVVNTNEYPQEVRTVYCK